MELVIKVKNEIPPNGLWIRHLTKHLILVLAEVPLHPRPLAWEMGLLLSNKSDFEGSLLGELSLSTVCNCSVHYTLLMIRK